MKKYFITLICFCATVNSFAQFSIGAKAGLVIADFHPTYITNSKTGFKAGLSLQYMFSEWGLQTGAYFKEVGISHSRGFVRYDGDPENLHLTTMKSNLEYFEIPLTLVYKYSIDQHVKIGIHAGPYLSIGYGGSAVIHIEDIQSGFSVDSFEDDWISNVNEQRVIKKQFKGANKIDLGLTGGLGVDIYNVNISANYDLGLSNVYKEFPISKNIKNVKNRAFWIAIAYHFQW
ncbi:MAG: PorT family protein [Tannerellaceae bacterium]|jgi:hypothetical protein|nr:PorT family protein [Tannerellaceae bacterium]